MFKNYLKTTFRNLWNSRGYSLLNITGLAIGIACAAFIFLWVESEYNFDNSNVKKDRLYRILEYQTYNGKTGVFWSTPGGLAPALIKERPEIANAVRFGNRHLKRFGKGDKAALANGAYADQNVFDMFTLPFVQGSAAHALDQPNALVLTRSAAKKFFGKETNVVGKVLPSDDQNYQVTAVIEDLPKNGTLQFEWLGSYEYYHSQNSWLNSWGANGLDTYVELKPGANLASLNKAVYNFIQQKETNVIAHIFLFSLDNMHLRFHFEDGKQTGGTIVYVRMFTIIAWIILLIACINFMNLATARSQKRAKEVGVRKVLGAGKQTLAVQFIGEAITMAYLSVILAAVIVLLLLPAFSTVVHKDLQAEIFAPRHFAALAAIGLICGLVAGSYPALYLSSFNPIFVFKGLRMKGSNAAFVRKGLVVVQFSISIILIISTIIVYQQVQHIKTRNLGMNKDNVLMIDGGGDVYKHFDVIKQDLLNTGVVADAAVCDNTILEGGNNGSGYRWDGKDASRDPLVSYRNVSPGFLKTMSMQLIAGRDFQSNIKADSNNIIINEAFAKEIGKKQLIGTSIYDGDSTKLTIVGVVKDFIYGDLYSTPDALLFRCSPQYASNVYVHTIAGVSAEDALNRIKKVMQRDNPDYPFEYHFLDTYFGNFFEGETLIGELSRVFSALAILISCLGLFGLAAFTAERRIREIGVRKVLGASVSSIATLLSSEFLQLVAVSAIIAFPLAWWMMHQWLQQYAYRITISWWVFIAAGLLAFVIALLTVSFQAIKAALTNPVKNLRTE